MNESEAHAIRQVADSLTYRSYEHSHQRVARMTAAKQMLESLLDDSQPDAHLQAQIDAALAKIAAFPRGGVRLGANLLLDKIEAILKGEQS